MQSIEELLAEANENWERFKKSLNANSTSNSLFVLKDLSSPPRIEDEVDATQLAKLFHIKCKVKSKTSLVIIDHDSPINAINDELVEKLSLEISKHPKPYTLQWLGGATCWVDT